MFEDSFRTGRVLRCATVVLACSILAACGDDHAGPTRSPLAPTPAPTRTPTPTPPPTDPGDVPVSGTMTCSFGEDEIGGGEVTFDLAAGTLSGWVEPFWVNVRYPLTQKSFATGATTFAATFGTGGLLEGAFHGPQAVNIVTQAEGGGEGFAAVTGTMTGGCTR